LQLYGIVLGFLPIRPASRMRCLPPTRMLVCPRDVRNLAPWSLSYRQARQTRRQTRGSQGGTLAFQRTAIHGRMLIGVAVLLLHGLAAVWLFSAPPQRTSEIGDVTAMTWVVIAERQPETPPVRAQPPLSPARATMSAPPAPITEPLSQPAAPATAVAPPDWHGLLEASARAAAQGALRQPRTMGEIPTSPYQSRQSTPSFPWSREPISKYFDFDRESGIATLSLGRCRLAFLLIIPGFGCALGRVDPEPGRADLFDERYTAPPIELPNNPLDEASDALAARQSAELLP